jgi:hypothetical protein
LRKSAFALIFTIGIGIAGPAFASSSTTIVKWTGAGSENLPCPKGAHWVITGGTLVLDHCNTTSASSTGSTGTLYVHDEGVTEGVGLAASGSDLVGDNAMALDTSISARAVISASPSPTETPSTTTSPPAPPTTPTETPSVIGLTVTPNRTGPGGSLAFTGSSSTGPVLAVASLMVLLGASVLLWTRRTKSSNR